MHHRFDLGSICHCGTRAGSIDLHLCQLLDCTCMPHRRYRYQQGKKIQRALKSWSLLLEFKSYWRQKVGPDFLRASRGRAKLANEIEIIGKTIPSVGLRLDPTLGLGLTGRLSNEKEKRESLIQLTSLAQTEAGYYWLSRAHTKAFRDLVSKDQHLFCYELHL